jgi:hypothetical protein
MPSMLRFALFSVAAGLLFVSTASHAATSPASGVTNSITLRNMSGVAISNYPFQFGRPFVDGAIAAAPQVLIDGTALKTQADVKNRYPDGSVEFAVLAVVIPSLPAGGASTLTFQNQTANSNAPLTSAQMLLMQYMFDAKMKLTPTTGGNTQTVDARTMLQNGDYSLFTSGPVAQTIILGDDTATRKYDIGFGDGYHPFRPHFYATFWPQTHQVFVRAVGDNDNTEELEDLSYNLTLTAANAIAYTRAGLTHWGLSRWSKSFWLGGTPSPQVDIDNNLAYLESTRFIPNFDPAITVPASAIADEYALWTGLPHDLYDGAWDGGLWQSAMGTTGARQEIGPYPTWVVLWLYGGDWRMRQMALGMADLAGAFPANLREGDPSKRLSRADPPGSATGLGHTVSITDRPTLVTAPEGLLTYDYTRPADAVKIVGPLNLLQPWEFDTAHQPAPFFVPYLLTGDPYYLGSLYLWAGMSAAAYNGADSGNADGRGPSGDYGGINDQLRGAGWVGVDRAEAAFIAPDGAPEKAYFTDLMNDALARWEGGFGIAGTAYDGSPEKLWAQQVGDFYSTNGGPQSGKAPSLHNWESNGDPAVAGDSTIAEDVADGWDIAGAVGSETSPWMQWYVQYALGREAELGFAARPLQLYSGAYPLGLLNSSGQPWAINVYQMPVEQAGGGFLATWPALFAALTPQYLSPTGTPVDPATGQPSGLANGPTAFADDLGVESYPLYLLGGVAMLDDAAAPGAAQAWSWMKANVENGAGPALFAMPKWAIVPRTDTNALPPQPTATPPG